MELLNTKVILREYDTLSGDILSEKDYSSIGIAYCALLELEYEFRQVGMSCPWRLLVIDDTHEWDLTNVQARELKVSL